MKAIALLKEDKMRGFRIDIETDSTVQQDAQEDKQARTEFIAATTKFVEQAFQIGAQAPDAVPMLGKILFGVRGFRAGRDLESSIEEFVDKMEGDAKSGRAPRQPPNPELQKQQLELQGIQAKSQAEVQKAQTDAASAADNQREMASKAADAQNAQAQNAMQMEEMRQKAAYEAQANAFKLRELQLKIAATEQEHSHTIAQMHAAHAQKMGELGAKIDNPEGPPMEGARRAPDGNFYIQHPTTKQFYRVDKRKRRDGRQRRAYARRRQSTFRSRRSRATRSNRIWRSRAMRADAAQCCAAADRPARGAPLNDFAQTLLGPSCSATGPPRPCGRRWRSFVIDGGSYPRRDRIVSGGPGRRLGEIGMGRVMPPGDVARGWSIRARPEAIRRSTGSGGIADVAECWRRGKS